MRQHRENVGKIWKRNIQHNSRHLQPTRRVRRFLQPFPQAKEPRLRTARQPMDYQTTKHVLRQRYLYH